jgi:transposase-like protein
MPRKRKSYSGELKARVAIAALKGQETLNEIASRYDVHPNLVSLWKKQAQEELPGVFSDRRVRGARDDEELRDRLYQQIGQLKVELDWLKKKVGHSG